MLTSVGHRSEHRGFGVKPRRFEVGVNSGNGGMF